MMTRAASWGSLALVLVVTGTTLVGIEPSGAAASASHDVFMPVGNVCPLSQQDI
jgi:hypothetical protein